MFRVLDGLPLAIAQAGAYLQETQVGIGTYLEFYEQQWRELMESGDLADGSLLDYPDGSVWTTWVLSYNAIQNKDKNAANLLLLWAFLDHRDLWDGLFAAACKASTFTAKRLSKWIGKIASNKLEFTNAIRLLRNYSLIEKTEDLGSYATHPVVHKWAYHFQGGDSRVALAQLAVAIVGWAVPHSSTRDYSAMQRRLLPHAQVCYRWVLTGDLERRTGNCDIDKVGFDETVERMTTLDAIHLLGLLYADQGKLAEAEKNIRAGATGRGGTRSQVYVDT